MNRLTFSAILLLAFGTLSGLPQTAHAAESYDNCTGFITSIPAVITTQGTWCLKQNLATAMTSGSAIDIKTNNVTIDCNNFKLGGLAAGLGTAAYGIFSTSRFNITVRHCVIRGFQRGMFLANGPAGLGGGHLIEDNRFDGNTYVGLSVGGDGSTIQRNLVTDTGESTSYFDGFGIFAYGSVDIRDNTVSGVATRGSYANGDYANGIYAMANHGGSVRGNRVRGLVPTARGIYVDTSDRVTLRDNALVGSASSGSTGISCNSVNSHAKDNVVNGFATGITTCSDDGNVKAP